ncbi:tetratricopeptide repeat protein [Actinosynnema sp. NPDC002837]
MVDLRGYDRGGRHLTASDALRSLLVAIGVRAEQVPTAVGERELLWRSVLAEHDRPERRMLIILDNAASAEQVRPLLPGGGHRVLVTSRTTLSGLQGARLLDLDVLPDQPATTLLAAELTTARSDDGRVRSDPASARRLVELCCGLPLALRTAIALLAADPTQPLVELVADLADERGRLAELDVEADLSVRAAFNLSYQRLADADARVFRLLALSGGPEIGTQAVTALVRVDEAAARRSLRRLVHAYLVAPGSARGRWRIHDLLRLYAGELAEQDPDRPAAAKRLVRHYADLARYAAQRLDPRVPADRCSPRFPSRADAVAWFDVEHPNLVAGVDLAGELGLRVELRDLAAAMDPHFDFRKNWNAWIHVARAAVRASQGISDRAGESNALTSLGNAYHGVGQHEKALECHGQALALARELGDRFGESNALSNIGNAECALGRATDAVRHYTASLTIRRDIGDRMGEARTRSNLGHAYLDLHDPARAIEEFEGALAMAEDGVPDRTDRYSEGVTLHRLGDAYRSLHRMDQAEGFYQRALAVHREQGDRLVEAIALSKLSDRWFEMGRRAESAVVGAESRGIHEELVAATARRSGIEIERYEFLRAEPDDGELRPAAPSPSCSPHTPMDP